ncbi:Tagatose-6-phosphate kinase [Pseudomonas sp. THAF187a]|uniref:1-phosphofructokinase n=1 Tax=unclassified Pseudomonas TaxID=196821 RepID=UPI001267B360|nr:MULTISPECIES: 1-phosphofructokinase [unclassified Pseudomonas]QFT20752.1 Tagatose-6-phosphate kinase [Pseudomonas sp. THAF187a]QFT40941.1 Tagatose-6-phosphate kinase [Pseudomonas sp. THAF42]
MARILTLTLNPALDLTLRLPSLQPGAINRCDELRSHAAGKGLNVAQVLADLGHSLSVSGFLGRANAAPFERLMQACGFHDLFVRVPGETRSNIKLAEADGRITDLNSPGPQVEAEHLQRLEEELQPLLAGHDAVVVAGSLPRGVTTQWFASLLRRIKASGVPLVVDSSGAALQAALGVVPWLIKPNEEELREACGNDLPAAITRLRGQGIEHVLLSRGADGVEWHGPGIALRAVPPRVEVASTVGAGDSLLAASLHGLLQGWPAERTLRLATAVAAQAVTQIGFGIHDREQLARFEAAVQLHRPEQ